MGNLVTFMAPLLFAPDIVNPQHLDYALHLKVSCTDFTTFSNLAMPCIPGWRAFKVFCSCVSAGSTQIFFTLHTSHYAHGREGVAAQTSLRLPVFNSVLISPACWAIRFGRCVVLFFRPVCPTVSNSSCFCSRLISNSVYQHVCIE